MLLNLWNRDELINDFMKIYNLTEIQMCNIIRRLYVDNDRDDITIFCEETGVKLDVFDVAQDIEFLGKVVSTTVDDFECLKQIGLAPMDVLLEEDTPISRHLKNIRSRLDRVRMNCFMREKRFTFHLIIRIVNGVFMVIGNVDIADKNIKTCLAHT